MDLSNDNNTFSKQEEDSGVIVKIENPDEFFDGDILMSDITQTISYNKNDSRHKNHKNSSKLHYDYHFHDYRSSTIKEFEKKVRNCDLNDEATKFIKNPNERNIFFPNFDYHEAKVAKNDQLMEIRNYVRNILENEFERCKRSKIFNEENFGEKSCKTEPQCKEEQVKEEKDREKKEQSPDIFEGYEEELNDISRTVNEKKNSEEKDALDLSNAVNKLDISPRPSFDCLMHLAESTQIEKNISKNKLNKLARRDELTIKIENMIISLLEDLVHRATTNFCIRHTLNFENYVFVGGILKLKSEVEASQKKVSVHNLKSEHHFALIMYVLAEIYHLLITKSTCTVRELYYKDPELAENQINVSNAIKDICCLFNAAPWEFGIMSSVKGLIAGSLVITLSNGEIVDCSKHANGMNLPQDTANIIQIQSNAEFVLLIEKDTIFEKLLQQNILLAFKKDIIMITGKGFPDINTRIMIKKIWESLKIPIYAMVDADPSGVEILLVYLYGSRTMIYNSDALACPSIRWIGIYPSEIDVFSITSSNLTQRDKNKIKDFLERNYVNKEIKNELRIMESTNKKAEIEGLLCSSQNFFINDYILNKIKYNLTI